MESDFASLVVGLLVVEGVGRALDPGTSLIMEAIPTLVRNAEARKILLQSGGLRLLNSLIFKANHHTGLATDQSLPKPPGITHVQPKKYVE